MTSHIDIGTFEDTVSTFSPGLRFSESRPSVAGIEDASAHLATTQGTTSEENAWVKLLAEVLRYGHLSQFKTEELMALEAQSIYQEYRSQHDDSRSEHGT